MLLKALRLVSLVSAMASELQDQIRQAVREAVQEELTAVRAKAASKPAAKKTPKTEFDYTRRAEVNLSDPRQKKTQWPRYNDHRLKTGSNRYGQWEECVKCALRGAPAQTTHVDHPTNVVDALSRLRQGGWSENDITSTQVKAMITVVAKEQQLLKPKGKTG